ncbi:YbaK family protein [Anoxybacillus sp. LAT_35]|uniref:DUF2521 family protein n=1 Tax=Anoxybacillus TaxID=150247 RepID=UPI001EDAB385|nr:MULTISPECIES: DUF2521 family protein [Anoxybacillus]MCG5025773.1 YbaK family protein [Anoxybacillus flavithermus]MCG6196326.1 YbaK family protein [Anoxybacillus sp. LAT_38]MCG3085485.1 YbaK family protein [Anoxybacillus sp. LAT27]MCG6170748.1 YbaK family protein [Anoxybacillus sp. LAT_11]MCG6175699.1 YbaK family protein [Anoxybacillus sp. LAT_31]
MGILTSFTVKKVEKQLIDERNALRDLSYRELWERTRTYWKRYIVISECIETICIDVAIEAYLIGVHYSRFIYYGESTEAVRGRCIDEYTQLIYELYEHMKEYGDDMYDVCARYIDEWWKEGIGKGLRRQRLRLK